MKILFITHRFPYPPTSGSKIRAFQMIRHLHATHEVTVASLARSEEEMADGRGIADHCARYEMVRVHNPIQVGRMLLRLPTLTTSSAGFFHSSALAGKIRRLLANERFDLVVVHSSSVAHYVERVQGIPKILDFCDMDSQKWLAYAHHRPFPLSLGYRFEGWKLVAEEKRLARRFALCTTATRAELATLDGYATGAEADWFPNGVDAEYFAPDGVPYDPDTISFVGRMDYFPNQQCVIDFCHRVLPRIRARRPEARFVIVGADPGHAVRRLAELPGVTVTGAVPDVRPYLRKSAVMVAPLTIARGTQNKILEAMACGVPVVTSSLAAGGVDAMAGDHFLVADSVADTTAAVLEMMTNESRHDQIARAGRARILSRHTWEQAMRRLDGIIERCMAHRIPGEQSRGAPEHGPEGIA